MRKLKLQMQLTLDSYVCGPNGELDWMNMNWDDKLNKYISELTSTIDCIILGRKLAEGFIPYWANVASNPSDPSYPFGRIMNDTRKVVFSKTVKKSDWINTRIANGELKEEINNLKNQQGKDIIVYGGVDLVSDLIANDLIDELYFFVNPVVIGNGRSIFNKIIDRKNLKLVQSIHFDCDIILLYYSA